MQKKKQNREKLEKNEKKKRNALWIIVVIHSDFGCEGTTIPSHHLDVCIMFILDVCIMFIFW
jgi:hypothetical protein